ncbi:MAG: hypothetical protein KC912_25355 [Proteobacteria bacterium]|nr:hypothetical protein [Pseudomonadota bacterium]
MRFVLLAAMVLSSGCSYRFIQSIEDGPSAMDGTRTTVLRTYDTKRWVILNQQKIVHWECAEDAQGLTCRQTCDVKDDEGELLACPTAMGF